MNAAYRFRRRAFLASVGGAFGLEILLRNLEASAAGATSPPRLLVAHWPNGTVRTAFVPSGTGTGYVTTTFGMMVRVVHSMTPGRPSPEGPARRCCGGAF